MYILVLKLANPTPDFPMGWVVWSMPLLSIRLSMTINYQLEALMCKCARWFDINKGVGFILPFRCSQLYTEQQHCCTHKQPCTLHVLSCLVSGRGYLTCSLFARIEIELFIYFSREIDAYQPILMTRSKQAVKVNRTV